MGVPRLKLTQIVLKVHFVGFRAKQSRGLISGTLASSKEDITISVARCECDNVSPRAFPLSLLTSLKSFFGFANHTVVLRTCELILKGSQDSRINHIVTRVLQRATLGLILSFVFLYLLYTKSFYA